MGSVMNHYGINSFEQSKLMAADLLFCKDGRACCEPMTVRSHFLWRPVMNPQQNKSSPLPDKNRHATETITADPFGLLYALPSLG
jgi:hypothetical protein